jgi:hypothetical protein
MPRLTTLVSGFIAAILCGSIFATNSQPTIRSLNKMPLSFTKNMGQWDDRVLFRASAGGAAMWFTKEGVTYQFARRIPSPASPLPVGEGWSQTGERAAPFNRFGYTRDSIEQLILTAKFLNANPNPEVVAEGQMEYKCNYFLGNDPTKWRSDVPNYEAITFRDIYPGIDLKYSGDCNDQAAYEFIGAPGADIARIKVAYEGAETTSMDADGRTVVTTKWGDMMAAIKSPTNGVLSGTGSFLQLSEEPIGLEANSASREAPGPLSSLLAYSTYLGGGGDDYGIGIAVDGGGNAYVTGYTASAFFPTLNPYQTDKGGTDVFVTKLSNSGDILIYSTYLGGEYNDYGNGIAVDGSGNAYVTGYTLSGRFPTSNPYQTDQAGCDAFVTKLSSTGNSLIYSTYLGGEGEDQGHSIAIGGSNAYVTGVTQSTGFPTFNPFQTSFQGGYCDAFVTKLSSSGNNLIFSTYLGGEYDDYGFGITVDGSDNAYVTGDTWSLEFPTLNAYQSTFQGADEFYGGDAFVTKLSSSGSGLIYSTYLGGVGGDGGAGIAVDGNDNAYVTGMTTSSNFPTLNAYQGMFQGGYSDVFVTKISHNGNSLVYSTYLGGGRGWEEGSSVALNSSGNAYVTGATASSNFPIFKAYDASFNGGTWNGDVFVTELSNSGNHLVYSTYLGGMNDDHGNGIAVDGSGNAYVTGYTPSSDFPISNPYQTNQSGGDVFVTKLRPAPPYLPGDATGDAVVDIADAVSLIAYIFSGGSAPSPLLAGDANCDSTVDISDVVYLLAYIFGGGSAPCAGFK